MPIRSFIFLIKIWFFTFTRLAILVNKLFNFIFKLLIFSFRLSHIFCFIIFFINNLVINAIKHRFGLFVRSSFQHDLGASLSLLSRSLYCLGHHWLSKLFYFNLVFLIQGIKIKCYLTFKWRLNCLLQGRFDWANNFIFRR